MFRSSFRLLKFHGRRLNLQGLTISSYGQPAFRRALSHTKTHFSTVQNVQNAIPNVTAETYGQPTPETHPHLMQPKELLPGIVTDEFVERRQSVMESIQKYARAQDKNLQNHLVIIPSSTKKYMSDKIPYVFRQNSDFLYLSGCLEVDTVLVMWIDATRTTKSAMFMRPKDKHAELWDGARTGVDNTPGLFKVDECYNVKELQNFLVKFQKPFSLWYNTKASDQSNVNEVVAKFLQSAGATAAESPTMFVQKHRLIKSAAEIKLMERTCQIASQAINETMRDTLPGVSEHEIFARIDFYCRMKGASYLAYPPVVAGGKNSTTIHYINNSQVVNNGDMVLMDAGCEYGGYTSDITRTWPINGSFSPAQQTLYEVVYRVQQELIETLLKEGGQTLDALFDTMCFLLGKYLQEIGLISKNLIGVELAKAAFTFCPHHVSHYLGMDVHDTPLISRGLQLVPGMVCTVEPGIYIASDRLDVPKEFRGMGIRIEDDILIDRDGNVRVLTADCVKGIEETQRIVRDRQESVIS